MALVGGQLALDHTRMEKNEALVGGGLSASGDATVSALLLVENVARGQVQKQSSTRYPDAAVVSYLPLGGRGAGLAVNQSALTLTQSVLALNDAQDITTADGLTTGLGAGGSLWMQGAAGTTGFSSESVSVSSGVAISSSVAISNSILRHNLGSLDPTVLTGDPGFLSSSSSGDPLDFHLSTGSRCVNAGVTTLKDPDGSRSDLGLYGGVQGGDFDLDEDLKPDWFWPGSLGQPPAGFSSSSYDPDDLDASR